MKIILLNIKNYKLTNTSKTYIQYSKYNLLKIYCKIMKS